MADVKPTREPEPGQTGPAPRTTFELLPAIDLRGGRVVRLVQGDFARETVYGDDPVATAEALATAGATWIHVVDLDGARAGTPIQTVAIEAIVRAVGSTVRVEVGGGLRNRASVEAVVSLGVARVVIGTAALAEPGFAGSLVRAHGADRIAVALDVRAGEAVGEGWRSGAPGLAGPRCGDAPHRRRRRDADRHRDRSRRPARGPRPRPARGAGRVGTTRGSSPRAGSARPWTCSPRVVPGASGQSSGERSTKVDLTSASRSPRSRSSRPRATISDPRPRSPCDGPGSPSRPRGTGPPRSDRPRHGRPRDRG